MKSSSIYFGLTLEVSVENFEAKVTPTFTKKLLKWSAIPFGQVTSIPSSVTSLFTLVVVCLPLGTSVSKVFQSCFGRLALSVNKVLNRNNPA